jgi:hypothetical protein
MSDLLYKAVKAQKNLDRVYPDRYWPVGAESPPKPHIIKVTKMYAQGVRPRDIVKQLGMSKPMVISIIKRSRFHQDTKYRAKHN